MCLALARFWVIITVDVVRQKEKEKCSPSSQGTHCLRRETSSEWREGFLIPVLQEVGREGK